PKNTADRNNAIAWLKICGSLAGQEVFNPLKASIRVCSDGGKGPGYDSYQQSAIADFKSNIIVPSTVHGFSAKQSFVTDFVNIMNSFAVNRVIADTQASLVAAA